MAFAAASGIRCIPTKRVYLAQQRHPLDRRIERAELAVDGQREHDRERDRRRTPAAAA